MPGLGGYLCAHPLPEEQRKRFSQAMLWDQTYTETVYSHEGHGLFLNGVSNRAMPVSLVQQGERYVSLLYGELYPAQEYATPEQQRQAHTRLLERFCKQPQETLRETDGVFLLSVWDAQTQTLFLANDTLGQVPLQFTQTGSSFFFSSQTEALLRLLPGRELNEAAFGQWLAMGTILNGATHFKNIRRMQPATLLTVRQNRVHEERYFQARYQRDTLPLPARLEEAGETFARSVKLRHNPQERTAVALSGGFDSRAVWAVYLGTGLQARAATRGLTRSADMQLASQISETLRLPHERHLLDDLNTDAFPKWAKELTRMSEGWIHLKSALLFPYYRQLQTKFDVLIDASGGAMLRRQHARGYGTLFGGSKELPLYTLNLYRSPILTQNLLQEDAARLAEARALEALTAFYETHRALGNEEDQLDAFYLEEICGVKGSSDLLFQSHFIRCRQPFYDQQLLELSRRFSVSERKALHLHRWFIRSFYPELARFPLESGDYAVAYKGFRFRRLPYMVWKRMKPRFLPGPKPFPLWNADRLFRGTTLDFTKEILLDPRTLGRNFWNADAIETLIRNAQNGHEGIARTLLQLLGVELFLRQFWDE